MTTSATFDAPSGGRMSTVLFLLSFATVLFTLSVWKLLAFFIMPSLFFDLLFIGLPLGACIGSRFFKVSVGAFQKSLWILQTIMVLSVLACLICKHFDYLRAHLFEVELVRLLGQMGTFTVLFVPFFSAYGLSEYIGYQLGRERLQGRMRLVYGLYLFGAASAYVAMELVLHRFAVLGVSHLLATSILLVAVASFRLASSPRQRGVLALEAIGLLALVGLPGVGLEERFLETYKGAGFQSTQAFRQQGYDVGFQRWGRYSLTEILREPEHGHLAGFYNDLFQWEYTPGTGFSERMIGAVPLNLVPPGGRVAIIGAGGGRQVRWLQRLDQPVREVVALELEPAVLDAVRDSALAASFDGVYAAANVVVHQGEARGYMERREELFDLIFLPSVGGYPQMMLEPGNMIRTIDAYRTLMDRLTERGILAIWYPAGLDPKEILTKQYVRSLGEQGLGMNVRAYHKQGGLDEYLIIAAKHPSVALPSADDLRAFLAAELLPGAPLPPAPARVRPLMILPDPGFKPITDEQPFLAGNVRHIFSLRQVYSLVGIVGSSLVVVGAVLLIGLSKSGDPRIPGRSYWSVAGLSLLIGANFILFEHFVILALFKKLYVFHDALVTGAISFLIISGLGSVLISPRLSAPLQLLACAVVLGLLAFQSHLSPGVILLLISPVALVTGSFFPALFDLAARNPVAVFAMDAIGAGLGSMCAFFLPIAFGFSSFFSVAGAVFLATAFFTWRFYRGTEAPLSRAPVRPSAEEVSA